MSYSFFAMLWRMKTIGRWGLMRSAAPENLAEHTLSVTYILHALILLNHRLGGALSADEALRYALYHDCAEILTGDLPTPVKYHDPAVRDAYKAVEREAQQRLLARLPGDMAAELALCFAPPENYRLFLKAADKLAALAKCIEERRMGNAEFDRAYETTLAAVHALRLPEAELFLEEFLPAYGLTLDEL